MAKINLLVLVANGARARVLRRYEGSDDLHTCMAVDNHPTHGEARTPDGEDRRRDERLHEFAAELATQVRGMLREHPAHALVLAAPARMLGSLQADLATTGAIRATSAKDLLQFDDHEVALHLAAELRDVDGGFAPVD